MTFFGEVPTLQKAGICPTELSFLDVTERLIKIDSERPWIYSFSKFL